MVVENIYCIYAGVCTVKRIVGAAGFHVCVLTSMLYVVWLLCIAKEGESERGGCELFRGTVVCRTE